jgi:hypothetical protein
MDKKDSVLITYGWQKTYIKGKTENVSVEKIGSVPNRISMEESMLRIVTAYGPNANQGFMMRNGLSIYIFIDRRS